MIDYKELFKAGVHWGHLKSRWCPRMAPYIWGLRNQVQLIDISKTAEQLEKAAEFLRSLTAAGKIILWVGTKSSAQDVIKEAAEKLGMPYVNHRWVGGTLSNYAQVKKSVTRLLHLEDVLARVADFPFYTKKDLSTIQKNVQRRRRTVGGIRKMSWPIGALVLVDVKEEASALREAVLMGIPIVALVDTNSDPSQIDYVIPGNDDTTSSVKIVIDYLAQAAFNGKQKAVQQSEELIQEVVEEPGLKEEASVELLALAEGEEVTKDSHAPAKTLGATRPNQQRFSREVAKRKSKKTV